MIKVEKIQIPELPTKKPRRLYVYTPKGYEDSAERYPVLYMYDGHNVFYNSHATYGRSWGMKEYLEKTKAKMILVAVECNPEGNRRLNEYTPWSFKGPGIGFIEARGRETMEWIVNELKPRIDREYRTLPDREHTAIAGSSMGGIMTLWSAVEYNSVFSRAAALSPSLWDNPRSMRTLIEKSSLQHPTRIYMDLGTGELEGDPRPIEAMFDLAKRLTKAGADVAARAVPDAMHNEAAWEKRIPVFMEFLWREQQGRR